MCCSMKACVLFLSSYHIWFAITQTVMMAPEVVASISSQLTKCVIFIIYSFVFFSSGFLIFKGADQESTSFVGTGATMLVLIIAKRYIVMYYGLLLKPTLPESDFLNPYGTTVPVIFTFLLYIFYLSILFCYHNELKYSPPQSCLTPLSCRRQFPQSSHSLSLSMSQTGNLNPGGKSFNA